MDNNTQKIRVLVVDDHPVFREGLRMLLEKDPKIRVVGEARDGKEAVDLASKLQPNVVLLDLRMPGCSGMGALKLIHRLSLPVRILILATEIRKAEIVEALSNGASGIVLKQTATVLLRKSIYAVMDGQYWIEREGVADSAHEKEPSVSFRQTSNRNWRLTPREEEIAREVGSGKTNNETARTLGLSVQTVKHYLTSIFDKIGVYNRLELALFCVNYSFTGDGNLPQIEPDAVATQIPRDMTDRARPKPAEPLRFTAADHAIRERRMRPEAVPGHGSTGDKPLKRQVRL